MSRLIWDKVGERLYETGVDRGVVYPQVGGAYPKGAPWHGLIGVTESPSGAEATPLYANNAKYLELRSAEEFGGTIEAYTYPKEFAECDGSAEIAEGVKVGQQKRKSFGLTYRTILGNDTEGDKHGYKIHIIYGAMTSPSEKGYSTVNTDPEAMTMSWEITTTPISLEGFDPTATIEINSTIVDKDKLKTVEDILYGSESQEARLPLPDEILTIINGAPEPDPTPTP